MIKKFESFSMEMCTNCDETVEECTCTEEQDFTTEEEYNEKKKNWIKSAIKNPGALKKSLGKGEDEKLSKEEISAELSKLTKKDKDKEKEGIQLNKRDATKKRRLELAKTLSKLKAVKENHHEGTQNYMFFSNLKTIKRLVDRMLEMDEAEVDAILTNGHNWALDHIATSKDDVEEVFNFLAGHSDEHEEEHHEEKPLLGGPESSHTFHDNYMRNMASEDENEDPSEFDLALVIGNIDTEDKTNTMSHLKSFFSK